MLVYRSGRHGPGMVLYEYQPSRARERPQEFIQGFKGYLVTDGYSVYTGLPDVTNAGLTWEGNSTRPLKLVAVRRKNPKALEELEFINILYDIEQYLKEHEPYHTMKSAFHEANLCWRLFSMAA